MNIEDLFPISRELQILDGRGDPTDIKLQIVGMDSSPARNAAKRVHKQAMGRDNEIIDIDALERGNAEIVAACIVGWSGISDAGKDVPYSHEKAVEYMLKLSFIREQVEAFVSKRAEFFRKRDQEA